MLVMYLTLADQDNANNEAVDTQDTSHNDGDEGLVDELGLEHTDAGDADTGLGSTVGGTEVAEHHGGGDAHEAEEGVLVGVVNCGQS